MQKGRSFSLFRSSLLVLGSLIFSARVLAVTPTVLIVETRDQKRPSFYTHDLTKLIKNQMPQHEVVSVGSTARNFQNAQAEIQEEIHKSLKEDAVITHLLILAPTNVSKDPVTGENRVEIFGLGSIYESGVNTTFDKTFSEIEGKVSPHATVIFDACNNFCARKSTVESVSAQIAKHFELTDGSVFASMVSNSFSIPLQKQNALRLKPLVFSAMAGIVMATSMAPVIWDNTTISDFFGIWASLVGGTMVLSLPSAVIADIVTRAKAQLRETGILVRVQGETITNSSEVKKLRYFSERFPQDMPETPGSMIKTCAIKLGGKLKGMIRNPFAKKSQ